MKNITQDLKNNLNSNLLTLTTCWKITRQDAITLGFTSFSKNLTLDGLEYKADTGFTASAFSQDNTLAVRNLELNSVISGLGKEELISGAYDYAKVEIFYVNWSDLSQKIPMLSGILGEITLSDFGFSAELRSQSQLLQQKIGVLTSPSCRARFGDSKCTKDLGLLTDNLNVVEVLSSKLIVTNSVRPDNFYNFGTLILSNGSRTMIYKNVVATLELFEPLSISLEIGASVVAIAGCNKSLEACKSYGNVINFQGEPDLIGEDKYFSGE